MMDGHRIGVLGGTFDPVHLGHLAAARAAADALDLDEVNFVPSSRPPHRELSAGASAFHRFAMAAIAVAADPRFRASDLELRSADPSFTAVTLRALHALGHPAWQLFFIIGTDAFAEVATWHEYPAVLDLAHFAVVSRPGRPLDNLKDRLPGLADRMTPVGSGVRLDDPSATRILLIPAETPDISSTGIRRMALAGASLAGVVPEEIERHIRRHRLYAGVDAGRSTAGA